MQTPLTRFELSCCCFQARQSRFYFPILIQEMYPPGKSLYIYLCPDFFVFNMTITI